MMRKSLALVPLVLGLAACGSGERNEIAVSNDTAALNADEGLAPGNEFIQASGNEIVSANVSDGESGSAEGNSLSNVQ